MCAGLGEVFPPPRNAVVFLLARRRKIGYEVSRRNSAHNATLRSPRLLLALSVCVTAFGVQPQPRGFASPPRSKTLKLSASPGSHPGLVNTGVTSAPSMQREPFLRMYHIDRRIDSVANIDILAGRSAGRGAHVGVGQHGGDAHANCVRRSGRPVTP